MFLVNHYIIHHNACTLHLQQNLMQDYLLHSGQNTKCGEVSLGNKPQCECEGVKVQIFISDMVNKYSFFKVLDNCS